MIVWNDLVADEKIRVYDRGVENGNGMNREKMKTLQTHYRIGDMWSPRFEDVEALRCEAEYFVDCVERGLRPINDGVNGLRVVRMLESSEKSLKKRGAVINLK
jgi:predicted dehydrogenase